MNLLLCGWDGTYIGKQSQGEKVKWGMYKTLTGIQNISVVRILDPDGIGSIIDEFSGVFNLFKTGTCRYKTGAHTYTAYSFMSKEYPYPSCSEYDMNELCDRWMIYYSWWNISLKWEDMYMRKIYGKTTVVTYPSATLRPESITEKNNYSIKFPICMNVGDRHHNDTLKSWLNIHCEEDLNNFINSARIILERIINRINPEQIGIMNVIISRIRNFLFFFLIKDE